MSRSASAWLLSAVITVSILAACVGFCAQHTNLAPGDGGVSSFYTWDKQIPSTPGQLLRQEPLPENLTLINASKAVRILYTSTDGISGKAPVAVSGAVYFPKGSAPAAGWPVIAWAHGTVAIADVCAPSWTPRSQRDADYLDAWLAQGYAVVATDYQGLGTPGPHPYHVSKSEAWSVLDSVRAALKAFPQLAPSVVIVGQSQGAHAALSAALLAKEYAPEIKLMGTVATGISIYAPFDPPTKASQIRVAERTGGGFNGLLPLLNLYLYRTLDPTFDPSQYPSDAAKPVFDMVANVCAAQLEDEVDRHHVTADNVLKRTPDAAIAHAAAFERYPTPRFSKPVFIGSGLADVIAYVEGQYNFVMAACYEGSTVEAHYYPGKDHNTTVNASLVDSVPFVKKLFADQRITGNCASVKPPVPER